MSASSRSRRGGDCRLRLRSGLGVVGHGGLAPGTLERVEAVRSGCLDIPSPRTSGVVGMERSGHSWAELNHLPRPAGWGSCRSTSLQPCRARTSRHLLPGIAGMEAADLVISQPVVDESEQLAGRSHPADVAAPAFSHSPIRDPDRGATVVAGHRFDRGPAPATPAPTPAGSTTPVTGPCATDPPTSRRP